MTVWTLLPTPTGPGIELKLRLVKDHRKAMVGWRYMSNDWGSYVMIWRLISGVYSRFKSWDLVKIYLVQCYEQKWLRAKSVNKQKKCRNPKRKQSKDKWVFLSTLIAFSDNHIPKVCKWVFFSSKLDNPSCLLLLNFTAKLPLVIPVKNMCMFIAELGVFPMFTHYLKVATKLYGPCRTNLMSLKSTVPEY